jgi:hypothetical protein
MAGQTTDLQVQWHDENGTPQVHEVLSKAEVYVRDFDIMCGIYKCLKSLESKRWTKKKVRGSGCKENRGSSKTVIGYIYLYLWK